MSKTLKKNETTLMTVYETNEVDGLLVNKANTNDTYTKSEVDTKLGTKVNSSTYSSKISEIETSLNSKANANDVISKNDFEINTSEPLETSSLTNITYNGVTYVVPQSSGNSSNSEATSEESNANVNFYRHEIRLGDSGGNHVGTVEFVNLVDKNDYTLKEVSTILSSKQYLWSNIGIYKSMGSELTMEMFYTTMTSTGIGTGLGGGVALETHYHFKTIFQSIDNGTVSADVIDSEVTQVLGQNWYEVFGTGSSSVPNPAPIIL